MWQYCFFSVRTDKLLVTENYLHLVITQYYEVPFWVRKLLRRQLPMQAVDSSLGFGTGLWWPVSLCFKEGFAMPGDCVWWMGPLLSSLQWAVIPHLKCMVCLNVSISLWSRASVYIQAKLQLYDSDLSLDHHIIPQWFRRLEEGQANIDSISFDKCTLL